MSINGINLVINSCEQSNGHKGRANDAPCRLCFPHTVVKKRLSRLYSAQSITKEDHPRKRLFLHQNKPNDCDLAIQDLEVPQRKHYENIS